MHWAGVLEDWDSFFIVCFSYFIY